MTRSILGDFINFDAKKAAFDNQIVNIHYTKIRRPKRNRALRRIEELAEDIREDGLENNLLVREIEDDEYEVELIGGERRYSAILYNIEHGDLTYEYIPCKKVKLSELDARRRLILNNHENDPLTAAEKLTAIEELREIYRAKKAAGEKVPGRIQDIIADEIGMKKSQVANYEKIINHAAEEVREKIQNDELSIDAATSLVDLSEEEQVDYLESATEFTRKEVEEFKEQRSGREEENEEAAEETDGWEDDTDWEDDDWEETMSEPQKKPTIMELVNAAITAVQNLEQKLDQVEFKEEHHIMVEILSQLENLF